MHKYMLKSLSTKVEDDRIRSSDLFKHGSARIDIFRKSDYYQQTLTPAKMIQFFRMPQKALRSVNSSYPYGVAGGFYTLRLSSRKIGEEEPTDLLSCLKPPVPASVALSESLAKHCATERRSQRVC